MSVGALPTQDVEKVTGSLKLPREFTATLVPPLSPGIILSVSVEGVSEKSFMGT